MKKVIESGIIANAAIACRDSVRAVRAEAIYMMGNVLIKLGDDKQMQTIRTLTLQYEIEANLLETLRYDYRSPADQQVVLMIYDALF